MLLQTIILRKYQATLLCFGLIFIANFSWGQTTVSYPINNAGSDDAEEVISTGAMRLYDSSLEILMMTGTSPQLVGLKYTGVILYMT